MKNKLQTRKSWHTSVMLLFDIQIAIPVYYHMRLLHVVYLGKKTSLFSIVMYFVTV